MKSNSRLNRTLVALVVSLILIVSMIPQAFAAPAVNAITKAGNAPLYDALHAAPYNLDPSNTGNITSAGLANLKGRLDLSAKGIKSLEGLGSAINVTVLVLTGNNELTDISPVTGMRKLQELFIANTNVSNLPPDMSNLANLTNLSLSGSQIEDTAINKSAILTLPYVKKLDPARPFTLVIDMTRIADVSFLSKTAAPGITALSWGCLRSGKPKFDTLAQLTQLKSLDIFGDSFVGEPGSTALDTIGKHLNGLTKLRLSNCNLTSLKALSGMPSLFTLTVDDNFISDLTPLTGCKSLSVLSICHNYLDPTPGSADRAILDRIQGGYGAHYDNQIKTTVHFDATPYTNPADVSTYYGANITLPDVSGVPDDKMLAGWDTNGDGAADHAAGSKVAFTWPVVPIPDNQVTYKAVYKDVDPNSLLTGIALSPASLKLSPVFSGKRFEYAVSLPASVGSVTITPAKPEAATMTIDGAAAASKTVALGCGQSKTVTIAVTSDKGNQLTYRVTVTRARADAARLTSMGASAGSLNSAFDPYKTSYTLTLPKGVGSVTLKPVKAVSSSKLYINGKLASSKTFKLAAGKSVKVTVKVVPASGAACTYTVTIKR